MREVKRKAKVGEYIKLTTDLYSFDKVGDILKVCDVSKYDAAAVHSKDYPRPTSATSDNMWPYHESYYVVLEGYKPPKKTKHNTVKSLWRFKGERSSELFREDHVYKLFEDDTFEDDSDERWNGTPSCLEADFECVATFENTIKEEKSMFDMTKLCVGDVVITRGGVIYVYMANDGFYPRFKNLKQKSQELCSNYSEDMTNNNSHDWDIMEVYRAKESYVAAWEFQGSKALFKQMYKRTEPKKMTVSEVSKLLGYEVEVIEG